jgi:hypothetical protein
MALRIRGLRRLPHPRLLRHQGHDQRVLKVLLQDVDGELLQRLRQLEGLLQKLNLIENQPLQESHPHLEVLLRPDLQPHLLSKEQGNSPSSQTRLRHEVMLQLFPILDHLLPQGRQKPQMMMGTSQERAARSSASLLLLWDNEILHHLQHQAEAQFHPLLPLGKLHNLILIPSHQQMESLPLHYLQRHHQRQLLRLHLYPLARHVLLFLHCLLAQSFPLLHHCPHLLVLFHLLQRETAGLNLRPYLDQTHLLCLNQVRLRHPLCLNRMLLPHLLYLNRTPRHLPQCLLLVDLLSHLHRLLEGLVDHPLPRHPHQTAILAINPEFLLYHNLPAVGQIC